MRSRLFLAAGLLAACSGSSKPQPSAPAPTPAPTPAPAPTPTPTPAPAPTPPASPAPRAMSLADTGIVPDWIDRGADPCQDFFQYACGGFTKTAVIPDDQSSWGALPLVVQQQEQVLKEILEHAAASPGADPVLAKIGNYYAACMDEAAIDKAGAAPIKPLLDELAAIKDAKGVVAAAIHLRGAGVDAFFRFGATQDFADATQVITGVMQGGLGLPDRDYYLKSVGNLKSVRDAYAAHLERTFALAGAAPADAKAAAADVMRVETQLARLALDKVAMRDPHKIYHRIERAGLKKAAPGFGWDDYFAGVGIPDATAVTVTDPKYITGVDKLVHAEKPAALAHYLEARLLDHAAPYLAHAFEDEDFAMEKLLTGQKALPPRWRRCVRHVDRALGELLGQPYVAQRFAGDSKQLAAELVESIRGAMHAELKTLPWMDDATRTAAAAKLDKMADLVGYPDTWRVYPFDVSRTDFFGDGIAASRFEAARDLAKIGKPVDKKEWEMTPPTVNAYYEPSLNELALPAGQLQPPFFGATFHPAVNFGSTGGGTIGHEMTHGFDDEGSQFDGDGNLRDWWSKATAKQFRAATTCVQEQYSKYEAVPGVHLNGALTSGENIADIGGVKLGFVAYQAWRAAQKAPPPAQVEGFSDDQLYFLAYAQSWCMKTRPEQLEARAHTDPHSPAMWRVNGVIVDQPGFGPAFACKAGTPMNPGKACSVW